MHHGRQLHTEISFDIEVYFQSHNCRRVDHYFVMIGPSFLSCSFIEAALKGAVNLPELIWTLLKFSVARFLISAT
jgi:hypothetical protein